LALQFSDNHFSFSGKSEESQRLEEIVVPKAMALYPYEGKGISVGKKEVLALIDNSNKGELYY
jgi:hypothetical protein